MIVKPVDRRKTRLFHGHLPEEMQTVLILVLLALSSCNGWERDSLTPDWGRRAVRSVSEIDQLDNIDEDIEGGNINIEDLITILILYIMLLIYDEMRRPTTNQRPLSLCLNQVRTGLEKEAQAN